MRKKKNRYLYWLPVCTLFLMLQTGCQDRVVEQPVSEPAPAQPQYNPDGTRKGVLYVKFASTPEMNQALMSRSGSSCIGVQSVDHVTSSLGEVKMERVIPVVGKFEKKHQKYGLDRWYRLEFDENIDLTKLTRSYAASDVIESVDFEYEIKPCSAPVMPFNDPGLPSQWHYDLGNVTTNPDANIGLFKAWQVTSGRRDVIVAIVDQGIDYSHPDLAANMWINEAEKSGKPYTDDDGNGYKDDVYGYDFRTNTGYITGCSHGTHVGGTVSAVNNNGIGVCGIAGGTGKGDGVRLMSCQIGGEYSAMGGEVAAIIYAADNGAVIAQCSWGAKGNFSGPLKNAIDYFIAEAGCDENGEQTGPMKGGVLFFAAGNDNEKNSNFYPASYEPVVAVAATTTDNKRAWYSNYADWVDLSAPGGNGNKSDETLDVYSTLVGSYGYMDGTSMACPHVTGIAALVISAKGGPGFTNEMLKERLFRSTIELNPAEPDRALMGRGLLRADLALWENDGVAPDPVKNLEVKENGDSTVLLWTITRDLNDVKARSYRVYTSQTPLTAGNEAPTTGASYVTLPIGDKNVGDGMIYTLLPVTTQTTLYYAVVGVDVWGNTSLISNVIKFAWTNGGIAPDAVKDLRVEKVGNNYALEWSVSADKDDGTPVVYKIYAGKVRPDASSFEEKRITSLMVGEKKVGEKMSFPITFADMEDASYYFAVVGKDRWGNVSAISNVAENILIGANELVVYPNPVVKSVNLKWGEDFSGEKTVSVFDMSGRRVFYQSAGKETGKGQASFDLSSLASGKYVLKFESAGASKTCNLLKR